MKSEGFYEYIFPLLLLLFYFFVNRGKKKDREPIVSQEREEEPEAQLPLPAKEIPRPSLPPASRTLPTFTSQIEQRKLESSIEKPSYLTSIADAHAFSETYQRVDLTAPHSPKERLRPSRGSAILRKLGRLQDAFVLQEIFRRPEDQF